ncbi:MAG: DUF2282 domain-containing protein [Cocleimonas sp.]
MNNITIKTTFIPLLAISLLAITSNSFAKKDATMEKCVGIAATGKGDGKVSIDGKTMEWIYIPAGQCQKLIGGEVYIEEK